MVAATRISGRGRAVGPGHGPYGGASLGQRGSRGVFARPQDRRRRPGLASGPPALLVVVSAEPRKGAKRGGTGLPRVTNGLPVSGNG